MRTSRLARAELVVALFVVVAVVVAAALARRYGWSEASAVVTVVGLPMVVVGFYVTLEGRFRPAAGENKPSDLAKIADDLAIGVRRQWEAEAGARRLYDPYAMPVRWHPADPDLVESWETVVRQATTGPGWPRPLPGAWASGPGGLAGEGSDLVDVLCRLPTGRLVVLGEPGTGKTILLVRLVLDLLARRVPGEPVPVLVPLASWNPGKQGLHDWLETRLALDYPGLREPTPGGGSGTSCGRALLDAGLILPALDGLDEIPDAWRARAIARINDAVRPGQRLVLSARSRAYRAATRPPGRIEVTVTGAAGVQLCQLDTEVVADYLRNSAGGPASAARWAPVLTALASGASRAPVADALRTPLMVALARTIYNPRPGESATGTLPDPAELLDPARFPARADIEDHLFDAFVAAAYRPRPGPARLRWTAGQAERCLRLLARHVDRLGTTDLAWWELRHAAPRPLFGLAIGGVAAAAAGTAAGIGSWLGVGFGVALGVGIGLGLLVGFGVRTVTGSHDGVTRGLAGGIIGGLCGGLLAGAAGVLGIGHASATGGGVATSVGASIAIGIVGLPVGFSGGLVGGFVGGVSSGLLVGLGLGIPAVLLNGSAIGLAAGLTVASVGRQRPAHRLYWSPAGLAVGLPVGLAIGLVASLTAGPLAGLATGTALAFAAALAAGLAGAPGELTTSAGPATVLAQERRTFWIVGLTAGVVMALLAMIETILALYLKGAAALGNTSSHLPDAVPVGLCVSGLALVNGLWFGLTFAFVQSAWGPLAVTRCWLSLRHRLPIRLMSFLKDAHDQGVLRQAGAVYQFRHAELQRRLARRP